MRILQVTSEAVPLAKTGGLADVASGLSRALVAAGDDVRLLMPAYPGCIEAADATVKFELGDPLGTGPARLLEGRLPGTSVPVWLLSAPALFDRAGGPYVDESGRDHADNPLRFGLLGRVAATLSNAGAALGWAPDVVHAHDWQAGLAPAYLNWWGGRRPGTVMTIHNLRFQGRFPPDTVPAVGLPWAAYAVDGVECYGTMSFLKAGLYYADRITTVSPTYAEEIRGEWGGEGLHGLLDQRADRLHGVLNGIDDVLWDPATDASLHTGYDAQRLDDRATNKAALQARFSLAPQPRTPLVGMVSRLTDQKGVDLLLGALPHLLERGAHVVVVGSGDGALEQALEHAAAANSGRIGFFRGYDEALARTVFAGADLFTVPSRFEPCGLTQMYALRYGALPVVRRTGGLADTVTDVARDGVGFTFDAVSTAALTDALDRALTLYADAPRWSAIQRRAMALDFAWSSAATKVRRIYGLAVADASST
ncbi:MAG: glycogen synthase GlgA [Myxococcota bacterium]